MAGRAGSDPVPPVFYSFHGRNARDAVSITRCIWSLRPIVMRRHPSSEALWRTSRTKILAASHCRLSTALISGVRQLAAAKGVVIAAGKLGKFKTTFQDIIVISLLLYDEFPFRYLNPYLMILIEVLVYVTLALSIASAVEYIVNNKGVLNLNDR